MKLTWNIPLPGTGSGIPRSIRSHQFPCRPLDSDPALRPLRNLRLAIVSSPLLLHQAETDLNHENLNIDRNGEGSKDTVKIPLLAQEGDFHVISFLLVSNISITF